MARSYNWPINPTTVNAGPVQYEVDGIPTTVNVDTGTPANSTPLPVRVLNPSGLEVDPLTDAQLRASPVPVYLAARSYINSARIDYQSTPVTDSAWVQVLASVGTNPIQAITLFDGGGFAMELGFGGSGSETRALLIPPGGFNGELAFLIPANTRLSVRAVGATTVNAGELDINLLG